ncbi:unnamed protein product [Adineta ricciae]|uniref:DED domain-containing protein n=1 Tax=Adineta ricciae TaxID=249248 RepID=A0A815W6P0_ADIRI|nr:unnamed protein product [Adineta ricciae]
MDNIRLRSIILKLQDRLSNDDRKRLHFYLGNDVPRRIRDDPTLGGTLNLMDSLFDQDIINEKDFTYLIRAFDDIHCFDAVKLLKEHFNQNREDILNQSVQSLSLIMPHIFETLEADQEEDKADYIPLQNLTNNHDIIINNQLKNRNNSQEILFRKSKRKILSKKCLFLFILLSFGICVFLILWSQYTLYQLKNNSKSLMEMIQHEKTNQTETILLIKQLENNLTLSMEVIQQTKANHIEIMLLKKQLQKFRKQIHPTKIKFDGWKQNAVTIAGGNGEGNESKQLSEPYGIFIDNHQDIFIADYKNHRIVKWKLNETQGKIIAGGNGYGSRMDQLNRPTNVIVDEEKNSLIIADTENRRVIQWSLNQNQQEILIESILCYGVTKDKYGYFYASDWNKNKVTRWKMGDVKGKQGTLVAGGNGRGIELNQFVGPTFIFVDDDQSIYVSDLWNHRVMKWRKDANEGIVVAGGNGDGNQLNQLNGPLGIIVDDCGNIYVADRGNDRIMRWSEGAKEGEIIVGGNGRGNELNQLSYPIGLSFDIEGNLYVADGGNDRISRFDLISS